MARPVAYGRNILETSTITVTGEAIGLGKERLSDRDKVLLYQDSAIMNPRRITAVQIGTPKTFDTWIVPEGHNLSGLTLDMETSPDGVGSWTIRDTVVASSARILRAIPGGPYATVGARLTINNPVSVPQLPELMFSLKYELPVGPSIGGLVAGDTAGIARHVSQGGHVWKTRRYGPLWQAAYALDDLTVPQRDALLAFYEELASGAKPFYLTDHDETVTRWVEWVESEALFAAAPIALHGTTMTFRETP